MILTVTGDGPNYSERDENTCREPLKPSELAKLGRMLETLERAKAKERQKEGGTEGGSTAGRSRPKEDDNRVPENYGKPIPKKRKHSGETAERVGKALGMSGRTYQKVRKVVEAAEENPDDMEYGEIVEEMDRTGKEKGGAATAG